ncbi:MAG: ribbon-helix-helix domain-containing protein [Chloroflexota bacterium]
MKTIQMTIDETLLEQVDRTVQSLETTRSAFIRMALEQALQQYHVRRLEERDEVGYKPFPPTPAKQTNGKMNKNGG